MIPRILHRIWFGTRRRPQLYDDYWGIWQDLHPDWELLTWNEENLPPLINQWAFDNVGVTAKSAGTVMSHERAVAVMRADIVAYELVYQFGGVYVNCDMMPLKSFEPLRNAVAFMGMEDDYHICNAVMGGVPGHALYGNVVKGLEANLRELGSAGMELATGPQYLTRIWRSGTYKLTVHPQAAFYPVHHTEVPLGSMDFEPLIQKARECDSYACHMWGHRSQEGRLHQ